MTRHREDRPEMILEFIGRFTDQRGYPPSMREIMRAVGLSSPAAVHHHIKALRERGSLTDAGGDARATIIRSRKQPDADAIEMAWCLSTHGSRPPKVRPCKRHRVMAEWLAEIVLPRARGLVA